jgi:hypothetical protein
LLYCEKTEHEKTGKINDSRRPSHKIPGLKKPRHRNLVDQQKRFSESEKADTEKAECKIADPAEIYY